MSIWSELQRENERTQVLFDALPEDHWDWKPHLKSMSIQQLAVHTANLNVWIQIILSSDGLDFAKADFTPPPIGNKTELLPFFREVAQKTEAMLHSASEQQLEQNWRLSNGTFEISNQPRKDEIRQIFCHAAHHKGQLTVYLRMLDLPVPGLYGPSADDR